MMPVSKRGRKHQKKKARQRIGNWDLVFTKDKQVWRRIGDIVRLIERGGGETKKKRAVVKEIFSFD